MATTTKDYFKKQPLFIEQSVTNNGVPVDLQSARTKLLDDAISTYERNYLCALLGKDLAKLFIASPADAKWSALKDLLWDGTLFISPVANYIYFFYLTDNAASYNGETFKQAKTEGSSTIQVVQKQVYVWSEMKDLQIPVLEYLDANWSSLETEDAKADFTGWSKLLTNYNSLGI